MCSYYDFRSKMGKRRKSRLTLNVSRKRKTEKMKNICKDANDKLVKTLTRPKTPASTKPSTKRVFLRSPRTISFATPTKSPYRKRFKKLEFESEGKLKLDLYKRKNIIHLILTRLAVLFL